MAETLEPHQDTGQTLPDRAPFACCAYTLHHDHNRPALVPEGRSGTNQPMC
jgi:hypothetical protein